MNNSGYNQTEIRQYLLGRLDESLTKEIDERALSDEEFMSQLESQKQQLIEDGLNGKLDPSEEESFEEYFAQTREGRHVDDMLRYHYGKPAQRLQFHLQSHVRLYCEAAALILFAALGLFYIRHLQREEALIAARNWSLQTELAQEQQLHSVVPLTLNTGLLMGPGSPQVEITDPRQQIRIQIAAVGIPSEELRIALTTQNGEEIWSLRLPPGAPLTFDIPASAVSSGFYDIIVSWDAGHKKFSFRVVR